MNAQSRLKGVRILVVEDQYTIAAELTRLLEDLGAVVVGPYGRLELASAACLDTNLHLDAAVLDINLHSEAVFPVAEILKGRGIPFVFASGYQASALPAAYRNEALVEKPVDANVLAQVLLDMVSVQGDDQAARGNVAPG